MSLRNQLKTDAVTALKQKDNKKAQALRYLTSLIDKRELQLPIDGMTEGEVLSVLQKEMKNKQESKEMFAKASRSDLVAEVDYEIELLSTYLPASASEDEIREGVKKVVEAVGNNFGMVMKEVMGVYKGRADGAVVTKIVKEIIGG